MKRSRWLVTIAAALALASLPALAQPPRGGNAVQFRVGGFFPQGGGEFWSDTEDTFTLDISDFDDAAWGFTVVVPVSNQLEVGLSADFYDSTVLSGYRDWVDEFGFPILHDTRLDVTPVMVDLRFVPGGRRQVRGAHGQRWVRGPVLYFGGGIGVNFWEYEEVGDFLDFGFDPPEVFPARFQDSGTAFATHALAGVELPMGPGFGLLVEGRYLWSDDELSGDFGGLGKLKMDGPSVFFGASFHF
jgi:hypothetical protein